jgi:hypothetical protein
MADKNKLTPSEKFILDWQFQEVKMGDFRYALVGCIARADHINIERLRKGFPAEVSGYERYANEEGWWQNVVEKAKRLKELHPDAVG